MIKMSKLWCCPMSVFSFSGFIFLICFFHPAALSSAYTNENALDWLFSKCLCGQKWVRCEQWLLEPPPPVTPAKLMLVCVVCSDLRLLRKGLSVDITLLILHGAGRAFEEVWRLFLIFTERSLWWGMEVRDFHPVCAFPLALLNSVSPKEWPMLSKAFVVQSTLCRGSSVGMGAAPHPSVAYFVTLSWKTTWAATPAWLLSPDLSEQLKASFTHPHPDEYVLCIPTNLLRVLVIQSLALFDKQMPGGWIKHGYRNIALCLKLDLPA